MTLVLRKRGQAGVRLHREGSRLIIEDLFDPNPKQRKFLALCDAPGTTEYAQGVDEVLFDGSVRAGKSQACCKKIVEWAMRYGGVYGVFRGTRNELGDSTKKIMMDGEGNMPPALPPELIKQRWDGEQNRVQLINGAEILFRSLEPKMRGKIRNITFAGAFIDQIEELLEPGHQGWYEELVGRMSDAEGPRKVISAANPGPEDHWVCRRFGATPDTEKFRVPGTAHVHVNLMDNAANLHPAVVRRYLNMKDTAPDYYNRMVLGLWGAFAGKRFKVWDRSVNIYQEGLSHIPNEWEVLESIDYGWDNPFCCLWVCIDTEGRWWVVAEHYARETKNEDHWEVIKAMRSGRAEDNAHLRNFGGSLEPSATYLDPASWASRGEHSSIADEFAHLGLEPIQADNQRIGGWARLESMLTDIMEDGYSRLRILPECENVIRELPNLRIKDGTDDVEKVNDHAADALRYAVMTRMPEPEEDAPSEETGDPRTDAWREMVKRHKREARQADENPEIDVEPDERSLAYAGYWDGE